MVWTIWAGMNPAPTINRSQRKFKKPLVWLQKFNTEIKEFEDLFLVENEVQWLDIRVQVKDICSTGNLIHNEYRFKYIDDNNEEYFIYINKYGSLDDYPDGFYDQIDNLYMQLT